MVTENPIAETTKTGLFSKPKVWLPASIGIAMFVWVSVAYYYNPPPSPPMTDEYIEKLLAKTPAQHRFDQIAQCAGLGSLFGIGSAVATWLALLIVPWTWYFSLARLRELSNAVRGK